MSQSQKESDQNQANTLISEAVLTNPMLLDGKIATCKRCQKIKRANLVKAGGVCVFCHMIEFGEKAIWISCPKCGTEVNKLYEPGKCWNCADAEAKQREKDILIDRRLINLLGSIEAVKWFTFENWDPLPSLDSAYHTAFNFNPNMDNLYLWGEVGRGKTHLAYAIAIKQLKAGRSVDVLTPMELLAKFRRKNFMEEASEMDRLRRVDVLIIDDIGKGKDTEFVLPILVDVLNKRGLNRKNGLVITSNLDLEELVKKLRDDRLTSRLAGMCEVIEMVSDIDYRIASKEG